MASYIFQPKRVSAVAACDLFDSVASVYNAHSLRQASGLPVGKASLWVRGSSDFAVVDLSYGADVSIVPEPFEDFYLITTTLAGHGTISAGNDEVTYAPSRTFVLSPERAYRFQFNPAFKQRSVRVSRSSLHTLYANLTGKPVSRSLQFCVQQLSSGLNQRWTEAISALDDVGSPTTITPLARARFKEFALALLIENHPHDQVEDLGATHRLAPRHIRMAEDFMRENLEGRIYLADIAAASGCSIRSLQAGFRAARGTSPSEYLQSIRLDRARELLVNARSGETVTEIAMSLGFDHLGRFSAAFISRFGERPTSLLRGLKGHNREKDC